MYLRANEIEVSYVI